MLTDFVQNYTAFSAFLGVALGWFVTRRGQVLASRTTHTVANIHLIEQADFSKHTRVIHSALEGQVPNDPAAFSTDIQEAIFDCLRYMEKTAISIDMGYISERYHYKLTKTFIERLFVFTCKYISTCRKERNAPTFYKNYEVLFIRQLFDQKLISHWLIEFVRVCPSFWMSGHTFSAFLRTRGKSFPAFLWALARYEPLPMKIAYIDDLQNIQQEYKRRIRDAQIVEAVVGTVLIFVFI